MTGAIIRSHQHTSQSHLTSHPSSPFLFPLPRTPGKHHQGRGYDPRAPDAVDPLPGEASRDWSQWEGYGTEPSACPAGGRLATLCHDVLSLGTTLPRGLTRRVLLLTNTSQYPSE